MRRDAFLSILMVMVLIASGNLVLLSFGDGSETRFTPTLPANITTDTEINSAYILENTTVDPGVTLTFSSGASISGLYDSHLYVEGTLIVRGTLSDMVSFRRWSASESWGGITVNTTGSVSMENFTIQHVKHRSLMMGDCQSSTIKNGYINGGAGTVFILPNREVLTTFMIFLLRSRVILEWSSVAVIPLWC